MFTGAIPKKLAWQIAEHIDFDGWSKVFVGCSGSFRGEQAVNALHPDVPVYGNIVSPLTRDHKLAIQLSHNAIHGKDDQSILQAIYDSITNIDYKSYTGLTDDSFNIEDLNIVPLSFEQPKTIDLVLAFLPEDKQAFLDNAKKIVKLANTKTVATANTGDFDLFHDAVLAVKTKCGIINNAEAVKTMALIALDALRKDDDEEAK